MAARSQEMIWLWLDWRRSQGDVVLGVYQQVADEEMVAAMDSLFVDDSQFFRSSQSSEKEKGQGLSPGLKFRGRVNRI